MSIYRIAAAALIVLLCCSMSYALERQEMFNGKDLEGWTVSRCEATVEDGSLLLKEGNGLVYLEGPYRDFIFEFKWKARDTEMWDSGVYFRCDAPPADGPRPWPSHYQVNLRKDMEGWVNKLPEARCEGLTKPGEWNEMKLICIGPAARLEFNGKVAWEAEGLQIEEGIIALQAETPGGGQFEFKDIYLTELDRKDLFNKKDLTGWKNINCAPSTWWVEEGMIRCTGQPTGQMRTLEQYENFLLEVEWRHLKPKGNAGVMVWADGVTAPGVPFCRAVEVQVLDGREGSWYTSDGDVFPIHGCTMVPENGRNGMRAFPTEKRMKPSPEWNQYRVTCVDGAISLSVNGKVVTRGSESSLRKGYICLESEGSPIDFRNLRVTELPPSSEPLKDEQIAMEVPNDKPFIPLYTGVDLAGWKAADGWASKNWTLAYGGEGSSTMWTEAKFGDFELIADVKLPQDADDNHAGIVIGSPDAHELTRIGMRTQGAGKWLRYRIRVEDGKLSTAIGGDELKAVPPGVALPKQAAIGLAAEGGKVEWANLLIREL